MKIQLFTKIANFDAKRASFLNKMQKNQLLAISKGKVARKAKKTLRLLSAISYFSEKLYFLAWIFDKINRIASQQWRHLVAKIKTIAIFTSDHWHLGKIENSWKLIKVTLRHGSCAWRDASDLDNEPFFTLLWRQQQ